VFIFIYGSIEAKMIVLSNGGSNTNTSPAPQNLIAVGTVDGVPVLQRDGGQWSLKHHGLRGCFISAVTESAQGTLFAASHGVGVARSRDGGQTWEWVNNGIGHYDLWSARAGLLMGQPVVCVGSLPAHLYISEDDGDNWRELKSLRQVPSVSKWCFPPAPHIGHVKDIVLNGDLLMVGIEIGALLISSDLGANFRELAVDPNPVECDIHRILVHPQRPNRIIVANGIVGVMASDDGGKTWVKVKLPRGAEYPDAMALHPDDPDLLFLCGADGWPPHWYSRGRARGKILRSRDGGRTWERLLGGLPNGQRALFSAITVSTSEEGSALYAADTDGQIFESLDLGDSWTVIADVPPVSKGEFYRALVRERHKLANVDELVISEAAANRFDALKA
jgi:photosystem II stability/assembly factor-like uncharacterized protein